MMTKRAKRCAAVLSALICAVAVFFMATRAEKAAGYHVLKKVTLGGDGFWDYLTMDSAARRLYISRTNRVMVWDVDSGTVAGEIPGTNGVHGIALATDVGKGFTSNGRDGTSTIFDLKTLKVLGQAKTSAGPDAIIYDPASQRVFTLNAGGKDATAIDAKTGEVAGSVALGGKPEFAAADGRGTVFVNMEDKSTVVAIDSKNLKIKATWPLAPGESPSGMAIDADHHRLFIGCHNKMMVIMDTDSGKVIATPPIGNGVDANGFDPGTQLAFSSNGDGTLTVVHEDSPDKFTVVENASSAPRARTMAVDLKNHNVYLVTAEFLPAPAPTTEV